MVASRTRSKCASLEFGSNRVEFCAVVEASAANQRETGLRFKSVALCPCLLKRRGKLCLRCFARRLTGMTLFRFAVTGQSLLLLVQQAGAFAIAQDGCCACAESHDRLGAVQLLPALSIHLGLLPTLVCWSCRQVAGGTGPCVA